MSVARRVRSAISGRFVKRSTGRRHPDTTVGEGWVKPVAPPDDSSRPTGLPRRDRRGSELADAVLLAAAEALLEKARPTEGLGGSHAVEDRYIERLAEAVELVTTGGAHG